MSIRDANNLVYTKSTVCSNGSLDPSWLEDFVLNVDDLGAELEISVWHQERFNDIFLGRVRLPVCVVLHADGLSISSAWYPLQKRNKRSKNPVTGEIRAGFTLSGKTPYSATTFHPISDVSCSSSVNSTPEHSSPPRTSSAESFQSVDDLHPQEQLPITDDFIQNNESKDFNHDTSPFSFLSLFSTWLPSGLFSLFGKVDTDQEENTAEKILETFEDTHDLSGNNESSIPLSFFEDDGVSETFIQEDLPAPLEGGILLAGTFDASAKALNGILFRPGSEFSRDLADLQKTTELVEGPWIKGELDKPKRMVSYVKAATKLVKSVKATEDQTYSRADDKGFVLNVSAMTPDAPYGKSFCVDLQYCIFAGANTGSGEKTSFFRLSWGIHFLSSTMMKGIIESGARQGLQDSYKDFEQVLEKYVRPHQKLLDAAITPPQSDWQLAKGHFCNLRVLIVISSTIVILSHIYISRACPKSGLEVWKLDFPDTLREFITSAVLGIQIERIFVTARKFFGARLYKGSDHGVKAKGDGWLLAITLVGAQSIPVSDEARAPDPYVVFTCTGKTRTSSVKLQTSNPEWEERFEFDATEEAPSTMTVEVFNFEGPFTEAESVGCTEINFLKQTAEELADLWVPLEGKEARALGSKIHLRIVLTNTKEIDTAGQYIEKVEKEIGRKIVRRSFVKNASFQRLFSLPSEEFLVNDFSCSLKRKFLLQGRLFLSPRVLAFYSNIFGHKTRFMLLWDDIDEIKEATGSVGMLLNPTILVFTTKGRAMDAFHGAKSVDSRGRWKFQLQSFIHYKPALRTMMVLWNNRTLSPEQKMEKIADIEEGEESSGGMDKRMDDSEMFLGLDEAKLTEVHSTEVPLTISSMTMIYEKEKLDEKIAEKAGWLNYDATPWECVGGDAVQQRRVTFKLSNQISLFETNVTCVQQKTKQADEHALFVDELLTLHDVPFGDNFQIRVRKEMVDISSTSPVTSCKVFIGVAWHKSSMFQNQISKNIFERYTKHLKDIIDVSVNEFMNYKDEAGA